MHAWTSNGGGDHRHHTVCNQRGRSVVVLLAMRHRSAAERACNKWGAAGGGGDRESGLAAGINWQLWDQHGPPAGRSIRRRRPVMHGNSWSGG
jgi:hypothetical protein